MKKKILVYVIALFFAGNVLCQLSMAANEARDSNRVFVCAHSFMRFTADYLPELAKSAQVSYTAAGLQMIGGSRVIQHWDLPEDKNRAKAALREGNVDVLTLSPNTRLPDEGIDNFAKLGLGKNPKLRVLVQASWPASDGHLTPDLKPLPDFKNQQRDSATAESLSAMQDYFRTNWMNKLEAQVKELNQSLGHDAVYIIPVADAVFALRQHILTGTAPGLSKQTDLFSDDLGHPKPILKALVTYCHFAAITGRSPVGLPLPAQLSQQLSPQPRSAELVRLVQEIAWNAVSRYPMSGVKMVLLQKQ